MDPQDVIKAAGTAAAVCSGVGAVGLFIIRALIDKNNDRLMEKFNGRYIRKDLFVQRHQALDEKLDILHEFQKDRFDELSDATAQVSAKQESQNVRLAVIESKIAGKGTQ